MNTRPSKLYSIKPKFVAWCFDRAVTTFGMALESAARDAATGAKDQASAENKAQRVVDKWLSSADPEDTRKSAGFADPFAMSGVTVHRA